MNKNAMFVDHWEEFNQKRIEFRALMKEIIVESFLDGNARFETSKDVAEGFAEEKLKRLF